jgi:glycosyltransferase involved in cell wall biosynthesis
MRIGINAHLLSFSENYRQAGLSRYIYELVRRVPAIERRARVTAFVGSAPVPASFIETKPRNLTLARSRLPTQRAVVRIPWEQVVLPLAAWSARLDLLHCAVNVRPFLSSCPTVVTVHDLVFLRYPEKYHAAKRLYLTAMTGWSCRHAAHVIAVSEATRQDVIDLLGVKPERITAIHNGVGEQFRPCSESERAEFKRAKGLSGRPILYVGTLEPRKNLPTVLEAFAAISKEPEFDDVTLLIGGSKGWFYDEIFATAERLGLTAGGRVRFLGRVPDDELPLWYNIAGIFAYPSLYEGFGLPVLEAMACGTPVLASDTSSLPEVVGDAGILLEPRDAAGWAGAMGRLLSRPEEAQRLGSLGRERAKSFSWERTASLTTAVYRKVLGKQAVRHTS